jgi:cbb3-type cytochrome oxidase maturation protein
MSSLVFLVPLALLLGGAALATFLWSLRSGQYDDLDGAAERILLDDGDDVLDVAGPSVQKESDRSTPRSETP